ncbi:MAG: YggU family protein [Thermoplasmatales archaeon]|nr:MAG: YggU family protein [Thermoplasmatales archaeon]
MNCKNAIGITKGEVRIKLHVIPGSSQSVFPAGYNEWRNSIEIKVKAKSKEDKANSAVVEKIAAYFNISPRDIYIVSGQKSRGKTISIKNLGIKDVCKKIEESLREL